MRKLLSLTILTLLPLAGMADTTPATTTRPKKELKPEVVTITYYSNNPSVGPVSWKADGVASVPITASTSQLEDYTPAKK